MPARDPLPKSSLNPDQSGKDDSEIALLRRMLKRERQIRQQAERTSENATRALFARQSELELLKAVAESTNSARTLDDAYRSAIKHICNYTEWPVGHVYIYDKTESLLKPESTWQLADSEQYAELRRITAETSFSPGEGLPGRVFQTRKPLWIEDVYKDDNFLRARAADIGVHCGFGCPVLSGDEVVAVLEFFSPVAVKPDQGLSDLLGHVATQLGRVAERVRSQEDLAYQATHDTLTSLPNRKLLLSHLELELERLDRLVDVQLAAFFLDLDGFKSINDALGHSAGDRLLHQVAQRLATVARKSDVLGRLSGDEFLLICSPLKSPYYAAYIAERLRAAFERDFQQGDESFRLTASVGVALAYPGGRCDPWELIDRADAAMFRAKANHEVSFVFFDQELEHQIKDRLSLERDLGRAVERNELALLYEPQVNAQTGRLLGVEALLRWRRGTGEMLLPTQFIPLAEQTGLILEIGNWVIEQACKQLTRWYSEYGPRTPWISVNLSVRQLADPALVKTVAHLLETYPQARGNLVFEITESVLLEDVKAGLHSLNALRALDTKIAIDDFGTGYASLSYLRRFPASALKIDRSFVTDVTTATASHSIVSAIIDLAGSLNLTTIAEGVETLGQLETLRDLGCDIIQGFYLARPAPVKAIDQLLGAESTFTVFRDF